MPLSRSATLPLMLLNLMSLWREIGKEEKKGVLFCTNLAVGPPPQPISTQLWGNSQVAPFRA